MPDASVPAFDAAQAALADHDLAHAIVEGAFALVFPDPQARAALGLAAISRAKHATAWYLWTRTHAGAFEMALMPADEPRPGRASFALRYFPHPSETLFACFAPVEREARTSGTFDATGTPHWHAAADLDPGLFAVGVLELELAADGIALVLEAPDHWLEETHDGHSWTIRRHVPGLALSFAAVDPLGCALAYLGRRAPQSVCATRRPGGRWRVDQDGATALDDAAIAHWRLEARGFALPGLADAPLPIGSGCVRSGSPVDTGRWDEAARWRFDPVGAFCAHCEAEAIHDRAACGCGDPHHEH